jgi:hypothetical protein
MPYFKALQGFEIFGVLVFIHFGGSVSNAVELQIQSVLRNNLLQPQVNSTPSGLASDHK